MPMGGQRQVLVPPGTESGAARSAASQLAIDVLGQYAWRMAEDRVNAAHYASMNFTLL